MPTKEQLNDLLHALVARGAVSGPQIALTPHQVATEHPKGGVVVQELSPSPKFKLEDLTDITFHELPLRAPVKPDHGLMLVAEQALEAERERVKKEEGFDNALRRFRRAPDQASFAHLVSQCRAINDFRFAFDFIVETLRPQGLPRDGPFVWCSPDNPADTEDIEDPTAQKDIVTMATKQILTPPGVSSFLNLQKARAIVEGAEPRFSLTIIFDKAAQARPEFKALQVGIDEALREKWPTKLPQGLISPFHDGAEKAGVYEGYRNGDIFISPWTKNKPGCVNARKEDIIDWSEFYAGWIVRANVRPFAYDTAGKRGAALFLESVQFLKPGKRLDGRKAASESFPDDDLSGGAAEEEMV